MLSVREGLLGELAFEQRLKRLGRFWLRVSGGSTSTGRDRIPAQPAGNLHFRDSREPLKGLGQAGFCVCLPVQGRVEAGRSGSGWAGPDISPQLLSTQVPSWAMDMNVLMSAQLLMEQVAAEGSGPLLYLLYQHLLFNFHLWTSSDFAVRLGRCGDLDVGTWPGRVLVEVLRSYNPALGELRELSALKCPRGT